MQKMSIITFFFNVYFSPGYDLKTFKTLFNNITVMITLQYFKNLCGKLYLHKSRKSH